MVQQVPNDAIDAESGFDDVWNEPLAGHRFGALDPLDVLVLNEDLLTAVEHDGQRETRLRSKCFHLGFDLTREGSERWTGLRAVDGPSVDLHHLGLSIIPPGAQALTRRLLMGFEVIATAMGDANAFNPPVGTVELDVPAIQRVMRHFVACVLPESKLLGIHAKRQHQVVGARHEPCHGRVEDDALRERFGDWGRKGVAFSRNQLNVGRGPRTQVMRRLRIGIDEVFQLGHVEFAETNHPLPR